ncbi:hypothetical protein OVA24_09095 [Luteolibacter sp. SL250]|uniref:hypothetical protein n=1 Tax=Luteolibacter sp. SL250 TaxID=2995170 RepID=UPI002271360A|nr:hypothetical protein [Luteolibacter sp. SL250]WAC21538.1 hypothetical protein OVA24_09095 [Luteolibacter sp. SL250]
MHFRPAFIVVAASCLIATPASADETEDHIKTIRAQYAAIEAVGTKGEEIKFEAEGDPLSGTLTRFRKDGQMVKAVLSYTSGDHGGSDERFYYRDGKLFFIHVTDSSWKFGGKPASNGQPGTIDEVTEHRIYLHDGKVIRNLTKTASAESGEDLAKALAKAENKAPVDRERETAVLSHASALPGLKDAAAILKMME